ncbi:unnamed protein product [Bursaphelenchus okinawaensis]|uniref:Degenerin unc-8 n=1 Tax=Bursaphelenchus okinawaensis TaxID=465554 RepID=A0A811KQQ9_9BILA|nr:unnamed protein product [Bursaphelenchus okinawaensis]CAG9111903.1 unnamed protein product [Bursaphelenchus okinawaensis]
MNEFQPLLDLKFGSFAAVAAAGAERANRSLLMSEGPQEYSSIKEVLKDFCARTTSHGIPFIGTHSFFGPYIWSFITAVAFIIFFTQTYLTMSDYLEYRTIIEMQLKFEPAPFPAATICNLNAFKFSELRKFKEIEEGFKIYEAAIAQSRNQSEALPVRVKRENELQVIYQPVFVQCVCNSPNDQCVPQRNPLNTNTTTCICYEDAKTGDIWPCYPAAVWSPKHCFNCSNSRTCDDPQKLNFSQLLYASDPQECICQSISHYCIIKAEKDEIPWWDPEKYLVYPATDAPTPPPPDNQLNNLGDLRDRGSITIKTKENLIFLVAAMPKDVREKISYKLNEFVLRCSFNGEDCDEERDFQLHMDPEFGNCYTFNFNDSVELKNSRAGPMYGLRLLLNVNQSDYLPTTEAVGVRLVVHEQDQEPFPDTFGYSAPTGFVSSFGLKTKVLHRLDAPYGKCSDTFRPENYIYAEHYSPEGCYRNCFQQMILASCGCGDPRFPLPTEDDRTCDIRNMNDRFCLTNATSILGGFHRLTHRNCHCVQPCTENVFETAYSAAAWPALNFKFGDNCTDIEEITNDPVACSEYYRLNTAYIEIYYEQLNYETLKETAGYTLVNLFSDLGGNIGLWIGFSLITVLECAELLCELVVYTCRQSKYFIVEKTRKVNNKDATEENKSYSLYLDSSPGRHKFSYQVEPATPQPSLPSILSTGNKTDTGRTRWRNVHHADTDNQSTTNLIKKDSKSSTDESLSNGSVL